MPAWFCAARCQLYLVCSKVAWTPTSIQWQTAIGITLHLNHKSLICQYVSNLLHANNINAEVSKNQWGCGERKTQNRMSEAGVHLFVKEGKGGFTSGESSVYLYF